MWAFSSRLSKKSVKASADVSSSVLFVVIYTLLRVVIDVFQTAYLAFKEQIVEDLLVIESFQSHRIRVLVVSAVPLQRA